MSKTYRATAIRWEHGWELHVDGVGVTQCVTLDRADRQVRDLVCTMLDLQECDGDVVVVHDIDGLTPRIQHMRELARRVADLTAEAEQSRRDVMAMMVERKYSYADIAGAVGVSKGRVSQLIGK